MLAVAKPSTPPKTKIALIIAVAPDKASRMVERLHKVGLEQAAVIGEVVEDPKGKIVVEAA